jgi:hypothetical protein
MHVDLAAVLLPSLLQIVHFSRHLRLG